MGFQNSQTTKKENDKLQLNTYLISRYFFKCHWQSAIEDKIEIYKSVETFYLTKARNL